MLSRERRLKTADFEKAFANSKQFRHPFLVLRCYCRAEEEAQNGLRAAFVVPKKLAKATGRNRWRRRLRHWFYEIFDSAPEREQDNGAQCNRCDFIFMLTAQGRDAPPREVRKAMQTLWMKALRSPGRNA